MNRAPRPPDPPRWAEVLLRWSLPSDTIGRSILGDAREEYAEACRSGRVAPRLWYCTHALAIAGPYAREAIMDALIKDLRFAFRSLTRQPGSALISVLILALGIGLSTFMFSLVYGVFLRDLDVPQPDRIAMVQGVDTRQADQNQVAVSSVDYLDFRARLTSFEALAAYYGGTMNVTDGREPVRFQGLWVTANAFDVLGIVPELGRTFADGEDAPGLPPTAVIGYHVWQDRYGGDPSVLGRSIRVNGSQGTIVGVMPEGFQWPSNYDLWVTMPDDPRNEIRAVGLNYNVIGRLADGVEWDQAELEVARVASQIEAEWPVDNEGITARLLTVSQHQNGDELAAIFVAMMVAVLFVLLVACANVANLLLARAATRTREAGVRVALGAGRARVMIPFLAESVVLAGAGALLGTGLAYWAVYLFDAATATPLTGRPYFMEFKVDLPVLLWVVAITAFTALAAGIAPALQVSRADVNAVLKDESRGSSSLHLGRLSRGLVFVEVALSVALLVGAGLMTKSMAALSAFELPFESSGMLTARMGLFQTDYPAPEDRRRFWDALEQGWQELPGVAEAALAGTVPGEGAGSAAIRIEGETYSDPSARPRTRRDVVSLSYFDVLGVSLLEGEGFGPRHTSDQPPVALVNRSFADRFWPGSSAVGRRFRTGTADSIPWMTVVGVVPDLQMQGFQPVASPTSAPEGFYTPLAQANPGFLTLIARPAAGSPESLAPDLRHLVQRLDPNLPLYNVRSVDEALERSAWFYSIFGAVFVAFGLAALFMASVGLYGVLSFSVSRRTREMGIRMALGAGAGEVMRLILRQGTGQVGGGLVIGLVLAGAVSSVVGNLVFQVDTRDPWVFGGVVAVIVAVGLAASLVPARRATRVEPVAALRSDA